MKLNKLNQKKTMESQKIRQTKEIMKSNKITLAILASLSCLLLLFAGVNNLQAQEARQQGWSIGVSPFYLGAKIKTTTENTTLTEVVTTRTRTVTADIEFSGNTTSTFASVDATTGAEGITLAVHTLRTTRSYSSNYDATAIKAVLDICDDGSYNDEDRMGTYFTSVVQFDATSNAVPPATDTDDAACYDYFQGIAASFSDLTGTVVDSALSRSVSSENTSLAGNGLQLGYDFEKFRVSLSLHQWSAGDNKLDSQIVLVDWHLPYGLYAGAGLAQAKLETNGGSDSKIAPAVHFGYKRNFSKNFSIEAGLLWVGAKLSVKQTNAAPVPTRTSVALPQEPSPITSSVLVGGGIDRPTSTLISLIFADRRGIPQNQIPTAADRRIRVDGTVTPTYDLEEVSETYPETVPTKTTIEVEAPASLFIRFVYLFK